jgi:hypothetical protein
MASLLRPSLINIALSLRINDPDGTMKGFLTTVLTQDRLGAILRTSRLPAGWKRGHYDRKLESVVTDGELWATAEAPMPSGPKSILAHGDQSQPLEGLIEDVDESGAPILVAFRRSAALARPT